MLTTLLIKSACVGGSAELVKAAASGSGVTQSCQTVLLQEAVKRTAQFEAQFEQHL